MTPYPRAQYLAGTISITLAVAMLAACGGGGGSSAGTNAGPVVNSQAGPVTVMLPTYGGYNYWLAYQDGDGPWRLAQATSAGFTFQVDDKAGKYAAMLVEDPKVINGDGAAPTVAGFHFTRAEASTIDLRQWVDYVHQSLVDVSYTLPAAPVDGKCVVSVGTNTVPASSCLPATTTLNAIPAKTVDVFASHLDSNGAADRLVIQRAVNLRSTQTLSLDFSASIGLAASQSSQLLDYSAVTGETLSYVASMVSATGRARLAQGSQTALRYPLLPASELRAGDTYFVGATGRLTQDGVTARRSASYQSAAGTGQALRLPPYASPLALSIAATSPALRPSMAWTPVPGSLVTNVYVTPQADSGPSWDISFSAGWLNGAKSVSYTAPDLSSLGWKPSWSLERQKSLMLYYTERFNSRPSPSFYAGLQPEKVEDETSWSTQVSTRLTLP